MRTEDHPSLNQSLGDQRPITRRTNDQTITIITNHYLKNIREDLLEEEDTHVHNNNNEIIYIIAKLNGIQSTVMIDTGSNISLIDSTELERIQQEGQIPIPNLPVNNIITVSYTHLDVYKRQNLNTEEIVDQ